MGLRVIGQHPVIRYHLPLVRLHRLHIHIPADHRPASLAGVVRPGAVWQLEIEDDRIAGTHLDAAILPRRIIHCDPYRRYIHRLIIEVGRVLMPRMCTSHPGRLQLRLVAEVSDVGPIETMDEREQSWMRHEAMEEHIVPSQSLHFSNVIDRVAGRVATFLDLRST